MKKLWKWSRQGRANFRGSAEAADARIGASELEEALRSVEPAARLAPPRLLRRVVRVDASLPGFGFRVPHAKSYVITADALLAIADRDELGFQPDEILPKQVILLERPAAEDLEEQSREEILLRYWELLFHARVHLELERRQAEGRLGSEAIAERISQLGRKPGVFMARYKPEAQAKDGKGLTFACASGLCHTHYARSTDAVNNPGKEFDEIRNVLRQERFLLPPYDDASVYIEFAAVYLGMRCFKPLLLASFFPALKSPEDVDRIIAQDIDAAALFAATRLPGTPEPDEFLAEEEHDAQDSRHAPRAVRPARQRSEKKYLNWSQRAGRHAARGNMAGAVIRRARAEAWVPREKAAEAATALRDEVHRFVARLQTVLGAADDDPRPWRESLLALAHQTPLGLWTVEARLLYDLQRFCIDHERPTSTIDVMPWILSLGRRAIRRDLPDQRRVAASRHLRSAQRRLARVRISERQRRQLGEVLGAATAAAESQLREDLRPKIAAALDKIDLRPVNLPEEVSQRKIVEELLDRIVQRGFLTLGEVRDAISRNQLKEPDCSGPRAFLRGEAALRANGRLTGDLDGVYEPADFYLRWLLRFSHLMFGTAAGRFLTLYFIIPFGGAMVAAMALDHFIEMLFRVNLHLAPKHEEWSHIAHEISRGAFPRELTPAIVSGIFLGLLVNVPRFRDAVWQSLKRLGRAIKFVLFDVPRWFLALPWVEMVVHSAAARLVMNVAVKPLVPTLIVARLVPEEAARAQKIAGLACVYLGLLVVVNSRAGRNLEEMALDAIAEGWQRFGVRPLLGLFWFIVDLFRRMLQGIERVLYTVDEWLRFRTGQGRAMLVAKGALGVAWFFVAYVVRFCVTLLIEPQLNPLKHIPWVSVSHKIMLPIWGNMQLPEHFAHYMNPFMAWLLAGVIVTGTPGIFGFLIWELTANWRLFAANRPKNLRPVRIGSHGETMLRLLRPGIHSGTIPKRFAKLRRAERKALRGVDPGAVLKHREVLHHVEIDLQRYIEREFVAWFVETRGWTGPTPLVAEVRLATNEAAIVIETPAATEVPLVMSFRLVPEGLQLELSGRLKPEALAKECLACNVFRLAFINVLKTAGVDVLCRCGEGRAADEVSRPEEVGRINLPWSAWVAAWQTHGNQEDLRTWSRITSAFDGTGEPGA